MTSRTSRKSSSKLSIPQPAKTRSKSASSSSSSSAIDKELNKFKSLYNKNVLICGFMHEISKQKIDVKIRKKISDYYSAESNTNQTNYTLGPHIFNNFQNTFENKNNEISTMLLYNNETHNINSNEWIHEDEQNELILIKLIHLKVTEIDFQLKQVINWCSNFQCSTVSCFGEIENFLNALQDALMKSFNGLIQQFDRLYTKQSQYIKSRHKSQLKDIKHELKNEVKQLFQVLQKQMNINDKDLEEKIEKKLKNENNNLFEKIHETISHVNARLQILTDRYDDVFFNEEKNELKKNMKFIQKQHTELLDENNKFRTKLDKLIGVFEEKEPEDEKEEKKETEMSKYRIALQLLNVHENVHDSEIDINDDRGKKRIFVNKLEVHKLLKNVLNPKDIDYEFIEYDKLIELEEKQDLLNRNNIIETQLCITNNIINGRDLKMRELLSILNDIEFQCEYCNHENLMLIKNGQLLDLVANDGKLLMNSNDWKRLLIYINEERDQIKTILCMKMKQGENIKSIFNILRTVVKAINKRVQFAYNHELGYLVNGSMTIKIPHISTKTIFDAVQKYNLKIRRVNSGIYNITSKREVGTKPWHGVEDIISCCIKLIHREIIEEKELKDKQFPKIKCIVLAIIVVVVAVLCYIVKKSAEFVE